jgi:hypothetical protein
MLLSILSILGTLIPTILQNTGVIGASSGTLISGLTAQGINLFTTLKNGTSSTQDALAALAAASGAIAVLKATTGLPADALTVVNDVDADIQAALKSYALAGAGFDAALYTQIAPVA